MHFLSPVAGVPASILLPPELFNEVPDDMPHIGVYFALYGDPVLLPVSNSTTIRENVTTFVGTPIVAATVGPGIDFGDIVPLDPPVTITLGLLAQSKNANGNKLNVFISILHYHFNEMLSYIIMVIVYTHGEHIFHVRAD